MFLSRELPPILIILLTREVLYSIREVLLPYQIGGFQDTIPIRVLDISEFEIILSLSQFRRQNPDVNQQTGDIKINDNSYFYKLRTNLKIFNLNNNLEVEAVTSLTSLEVIRKYKGLVYLYVLKESSIEIVSIEKDSS